MKTIIEVSKLSKTFANQFHALKEIDLNIRAGEIFALLGPNGAGKTTLISTICGLVNPTSGRVSIDGHDIIKDYRKARALVGLVPQELTTNAFESVWNTLVFSRGLFGKAPNRKYLENVIKELSLWDKRDNQIMTLSGGMKRRVMIAKALSHEPKILFLDEPTAGVDVELRKSMWEQVRRLRESGVTIILTTHYLEEAEMMADRIGVVNQGRLILTQDKTDLMKKFGGKKMVFDLKKPLTDIPGPLATYPLALNGAGTQLTYTYDRDDDQSHVADLLRHLGDEQIEFSDLYTKQSSLEEIFVSLVR